MKITALLAIWPFLTVAPALAEDSTDPVFQRYGTKVVPSPLIVVPDPADLNPFAADSAPKRIALTAVATPQDVTEGRAVFTLDGLGERRLWKLPEFSALAVWTTLRQFPRGSDADSGFDDLGNVIQAEELLVAGKWRRYFGFVSHHGVAVARAEDVDFLLRGDPPEYDWQFLPGGLDWRVTGPEHSNGKPDKVRKFTLGEPLVIAVSVRNRRGVARLQPTVFYRPADQGEPALRKGVTLRMSRAPFNPRSPDSHYPGDADYAPLGCKHPAPFAPADDGKTLETGEIVQSFSLDLRDWFNLEEPGYYRFTFEFDREALKLPAEQTHRASAIISGFMIGTPPKKLTIAELNRDLPPLGAKDAGARIRRLIQDTCTPPATKPPTDDAAVWSEPVGGLKARIVDVTEGVYNGQVVLLGLRNVSGKPLVVPMAHPAVPPRAGLIELQARQGSAAWQTIEGFATLYDPTSDWNLDPLSEKDRQAELNALAKRQTATLPPGREAILYLSGREGKRWSELKIVLRQPAATAPPHGWQGTLETPPVPARWDEKKIDALAGTLPFPAVFTDFDRDAFLYGNESGRESRVEQLQISNRPLLAALDLFETTGMRQELERRLAAANDLPMKLFLASIAASYGSQPGANFLLDAMLKTDYTRVTNVHSALAKLVIHYDSQQPAWLLAMVEAALSDDRYVTGMEQTNWTAGTTFTISYLADETARLALALGQVKCREAVPFLLDLAAKQPTRMQLMALGDLGDARAIPLLIGVLNASGKVAKEDDKSMGQLSPEVFGRAVEALGNLKASEAVPVLLDYLEFPEVIGSLERIGDPRALSALRELVQAEGRMLRDGQARSPKLAAERLIKAKIALASMEEGDAVPRLCALLSDKSFSEFDRIDVIWRLRKKPDPRAIPVLINAIKTDPSGSVVNQAITVLAEFKYKAAVAGLIDCFAADFTGKGDWKRATDPQMFRDNIAQALRELTGQDFAADAKLWQDWWQQQAATVEGLK